MKFIKWFSKAFNIITLGLLLVTLALVIHQPPALSNLEYPIVPNTNNVVCYMQTQGNLILNLNSLCGEKKTIEFLSVKDKQFLEDYKGLLKGLPQVQAVMSPLVQRNPQSIIQKAAAVCQDLRTGKYSDSRISQPDADADILNSIAPEYYCPEFKD